MSYNTAVINNAAPAATLMSTVQPLIAAHPAWEFVETVVGSVATDVCDVYKCLGSLNSFGTDFFVGFARSGATAGTAKCGFIIGETYDGTAKTFGKGAVHTLYNTALTVEADFSYGTVRHVANENTLVALTDGFLRAAGLNTGGAGAAPGSASTNFTYFLSVTNDRICLSTSIDTFSAYAGLYESFHSVAIDPFPLIAVCMKYPTSIGNEQVLKVNFGPGGCTRDAGLAGSITGAFRAMISSHSWTWTAGSSRQWSANAVSKEAMSGKWWPSRCVVVPESRSGAIKGLLRDVYFLDLTEVSEAVGDILTIDGVTYTCFTTCPSSGELDGSANVVVRTGRSMWISQAA